MKKMYFTANIMVFFLLMAGGLFAQSKPDNFNAMLVNIDEQSNFYRNDFSAKVGLVIEEPNEATDIKSARFFRRDRDDKFLMLILLPESSLGQGYLRVEGNLWFYDPDSRKFTHTSMKENFQNSDAKNSDFSQSTLAEDYKVVSNNEGKLGNFEVWILELSGQHNEVTYPHKKIWVSKKDGLLLKSEDYSLTKRLLRTSYFTSYSKIGQSFIADKIIFVDALVAGKKTSITMSEISLNPIPDTVFSKAYVERVNR